MPLTPLKSALDKVGASFDKKLNAVVGIANNYANLRLKKQQMLNDIAAKKEIIDFRYDRKREFRENVLAPEAERQAAIEAQQSFVANLQEQFDDAQELRDEMMDKVLGSDYIPEFNLGGDLKVTVGAVTKDNQIVGYQPKYILDTGEGVSQLTRDEYVQRVQKLEEFGSFLHELKTEDESNLGKFSYTRNNKQFIGQDQRSEFIYKVKSNPEFRQRAMTAFVNGQLVQSKTVDRQPVSGSGGSSDSGGEDLGKTPALKAPPYFDIMEDSYMTTLANLSSELEGKTKVTYRADTENENGLFPDNTLQTAVVVDYKASTDQVLAQLSQAVGNLFTSPETIEGFDLSKLNRDLIAYLASGKVTSINGDFLGSNDVAVVSTPEGDLEFSIPSEMQNSLEQLLDQQGQDKQLMQKLLKQYLTYQGSLAIQRETAMRPVQTDKVYLDIWNLPRELNNLDDFMSLYKPIMNDLDAASANVGKTFPAFIGETKSEVQKALEDWQNQK